MTRAPRRVVGVGLRQSASVEDLRAALTAIGGADLLATAPDMTDHPALIPFRVIGVERAILARQATPTQSPRALARYGCGSLAEAAAMALGQLTGPRRIMAGGRLTVALALISDLSDLSDRSLLSDRH